MDPSILPPKRKISQYSKLPAFYYMGSIFLDWKNIDEYGIR